MVKRICLTLSAYSRRNDMELGRADDWTDMVLLPPHLDDTVTGHRFKRAGQIAGPPADRVGQRRNRVWVCFLDDPQQSPTIVAKYVG